MYLFFFNLVLTLISQNLINRKLNYLIENFKYFSMYPICWIIKNIFLEYQAEAGPSFQNRKRSFRKPKLTA